MTELPTIELSTLSTNSTIDIWAIQNMAENATRARTQSDAILQQCIRDTNRCIANPTPHIRLLKQKLDKLYVAIDDLQDKHIVFADKTGADIESEPLQTWINPN